MTKVPILTYHSIDDSGSVISTGPDKFRRQMKYLSERQARVISLGELTEAMIEGRQLPLNSLVLTFDDGYRNVYTTAFPILREFGFTGTVFLVTDYCGRRNDWPGQPAVIEPAPLLSWAEIKEMRREGIEFGSHTATHPDLTRLPTAEAAEEINRSKATIEDRLGVGATVFAYPYGRCNERVKELAQREFHAACSTRLGKVGRGDDLHQLKRVDMYYCAESALFRALRTKAFDRYLSLRQALRELKESSLARKKMFL
jgi:peptidoglycan/xylan/chitin deacetylase (PgdA/CDA1 family)